MEEKIHVQFTIVKGRDGGLIVYEQIGDEQPAVFGGNLDEYTKYMRDRGSELLKEPKSIVTAAGPATPTTYTPAVRGLNTPNPLREVTASRLSEALARASDDEVA